MSSKYCLSNGIKKVLNKMSVLTLQMLTDLLLHFLGFVSPTTNQLQKKRNKQLETSEQLTAVGSAGKADKENYLMFVYV